MEPEYFSQSAVVESMRHDHLYYWKEMLAAIAGDLKPGCRVVDFGCNSGELLRILCCGFPEIISAVRPSLAVGLEPESMRSVLVEASRKTPAGLPILFSSAPLASFPGQFDVLLSHEVLYLIHDLDSTFAAAHAALRPGGVLCVATMGYMENPYYQRWQPLFEARGIQVARRSREAFLESLRRAGFEHVEARPLRLTPEAHARWRAERPFDDLEWFESEADERRYVTETGKLTFIARKKGAP